MDFLQTELWRREPGRAPGLFDGSKIPLLDTLPDFLDLRPGEASPTVLLGQVIDVAGSAARVRFARTPGRNIAVIGSVVQDAAAVLGGAAASLGRQHHPHEAKFTLACLVEEAMPSALHLSKRLKADGHEAEVIGVDRIREVLDEAATRLQSIGKGQEDAPLAPHYLVLYGADAAQTLLEQKDPTTRMSGVDSLRTVLKHGPENRTHVLGWWRGVQRLKAALPPGVYDDIGAWVAFDVQGKELLSLGPEQVMAWSPRPRRGLFFDRFEHSRPQVIIPFDTGEA